MSVSPQDIQKMEKNKDVEGLIKTLSHSESWVRVQAAEALGRIGDGRANDVLIQTLTESNAGEAAGAAARALAKIGDKRIVPSLILLLEKNGNNKVRDLSAYVLQEIGDYRAFEPLTRSLIEDNDSSVRASCANALGKFGDPRAIDTLILTLNDNDETVRRMIIKALGKIGDNAINPLIEILKKSEDYNLISGSADALGEIGNKQAVEPLIEELLNEKRYRYMDYRTHIVEALGKIGDKKAVNILLQTLNDGNVDLRKVSAIALGKIGQPKAMESLIQALKNDDDDGVRFWSAYALGNVGDKSILPILREALKDNGKIHWYGKIEGVGNWTGYAPGKGSGFDGKVSEAARYAITKIKTSAQNIKIKQKTRNKKEEPLQFDQLSGAQPTPSITLKKRNLKYPIHTNQRSGELKIEMGAHTKKKNTKVLLKQGNLLSNDVLTPNVKIKSENTYLTNPKVFISYSWDNENHKMWVLNFASDLMQGIEVILDIWDLKKYGGDLNHFMEAGIRDSDYVILICTPNYVNKANKRVGGAGVENTIITGEYFESIEKKSKFIPIVRECDGDIRNGLPSYLKSKYAIDFRNDNEYEDKLKETFRYIFDEPEFPKPKIRPKPKMERKKIKKEEESLNTYLINEISEDKGPFDSELVVNYVKILKGLNLSKENINNRLQSIRREFLKIYRGKEIDEESLSAIKIFVEFTNEFIKDKNENTVKQIFDILFLLTKNPKTLKILKEILYNNLKILYENGKRYDDLIRILDKCEYFGDKINEIMKAIDIKDQKLLDLFISRLDYKELTEKKFEIIKELLLKINTLDPENDKAIINKTEYLINQLEMS